MRRFIISRAFQSLVTLLILSVAVFLSVHLSGDAAGLLLGPEATAADYEQIKENLGLNRPLVVQYGGFLLNIVQGDFGGPT